LNNYFPIFSPHGVQTQNFDLFYVLDSTMSSQVDSDDVTRGSELLSELSKLAGKAGHNVKDLSSKVTDGQLSTAKGVSFLETKNQLLLSYLINLTHLCCHKLKGGALKGHADIERLVEIRTVLEKMRPIDKKLRYQVDKLVKTGASGIADNDPLRLKPNAANLVSKLDEESGSGSDDEDREKTQVYKPPKLAAVHYDDDDTGMNQQQRQVENQRKKLLSSSIMRELRSEHHDGPEEIKEGADLHRHREDLKEKELQTYEENYFVRKQQSKKEIAASRQLATMSGLSSIASFGSAGLFSDGKGDGTSGKSENKKKRKHSSKGKKGAKKKKWK